MKRTVWNDMKEMIFEDIAIYSGVLLANLFLDHVVRIFQNLQGLNATHPIEYGLGQMLVFCLAGIQLARKINQLRYCP